MTQDIQTRDHRDVISEIRASGHWGIILTVAQRHGFLPRYLFERDKAVAEARNDAMAALDNEGVAREVIGRWWGVSRISVTTSIVAHRKACAEEPTDYGEPDETKPGMVKGHGEKREDCTRYGECLSAYAKKSGFHARCPDVCSGYRVDIAPLPNAADPKTIVDALGLPMARGERKRRVTDFLHQLDAPTVCAQARNKGCGI